MKRILMGSVVIITIIFLITVAYLRFSSISIDKPKPEITNKTSTEKKSNRVISGIFKLTADGTIISRDTNGKELHFKAGGWIRLEQLGQTGKYIWINHKIPSWSTTEKSCKTGPHTGNGIVELMSCSGQDILIKATILK